MIFFFPFLEYKTALATISQTPQWNLDSHIGMDCFELSDLTLLKTWLTHQIAWVCEQFMQQKGQTFQGIHS